jgi:hypothetical protein
MVMVPFNGALRRKVQPATSACDRALDGFYDACTDGARVRTSLGRPGQLGDVVPGG